MQHELSASGPFTSSQGTRRSDSVAEEDDDKGEAQQQRASLQVPPEGGAARWPLEKEQELEQEAPEPGSMSSVSPRMSGDSLTGPSAPPSPTDASRGGGTLSPGKRKKKKKKK